MLEMHKDDPKGYDLLVIKIIEKKFLNFF